MTHNATQTKLEGSAQPELYPTLGVYPPPPPGAPCPPPYGPYASYQAGPGPVPATGPAQGPSSCEHMPLVADQQPPPPRGTVTTVTTTVVSSGAAAFTQDTTCGEECLSALWLWGGLAWLVTTLYWLCGLVFLLTIVGIPIGLDAMRAARLLQVCNGRRLGWRGDQRTGPGLVAKCVCWFPVGLVIAATHFVFGAFLCLTLVGIPYGVAHFRLVPVAMCPFGLVLLEEKATVYDV